MAEYASHAASAGSRLHRAFRKALERTGVSVVRGKTGDESLLDFAEATVAGLAKLPRRLECRYLYDARGSALFERITEQPEYYLTRTEAAILKTNAHYIRDLAGSTSLVELGSGSSVKTGILLRAWLDRDPSARYIPIDVSISALRGACRAISGSMPTIQVIAIDADYHEAFPLLRQASPVMVLFLGSSIGNFGPREMDAFFISVSRALSINDFFLLGIDLVKEQNLIDAAYNDAAGISASFTRNLFARMNRELRSNIDLSAVEHVAAYDPGVEQVEIYARFARRQIIRVEPLERSFAIDEGEMIRVEICRKFRLDEFIRYAARFGFAADGVFTDEQNWFALLLLRRQAPLD
ncbi:MAG TPA: L-histidine N(alpha)-methyltransferase [Geobacteraceae bacterium]|nr:L-histidine N(alpha)-methyltransferase [Geobacteraceae bacterium]